jgi:hypothetical protein
MIAFAGDVSTKVQGILDPVSSLTSRMPPSRIILKTENKVGSVFGYHKVCLCSYVLRVYLNVGLAFTFT